MAYYSDSLILFTDFDYEIECEEERLIRKQIEFHLQRKEIIRKSVKGNSDKKTAWSENHNQTTERERDNVSEGKTSTLYILG